MKAMNAVRKLTGTTGGESPIFDGTMRGAIVGLLNAAIGLATVSKWVDAEQAIYIALMVNPAVFFLFGVWDRFWKTREHAASVESAFKAIIDESFEKHDVGKPPTKTTVADAMKNARLPEDQRIKPEFKMKTTQARGANGQFKKAKGKRK